MHYLGTDYPAELAVATWRKSSRSGGGENCVEVAATASGVGVRDSKNRMGAAFVFAVPTWSAFLALTRTGALDRP